MRTDLAERSLDLAVGTPLSRIVAAVIGVFAVTVTAGSVGGAVAFGWAGAFVGALLATWLTTRALAFTMARIRRSWRALDDA